MSEELKHYNKNNNSTGAWIFMIASIIYDISPIDIIPDIPVIGWIDDFFITTTATLNLIQKTCTDSLLLIGQIAKILKWCVILLGIIVVLLILLLGTSIIQIFT